VVLKANDSFMHKSENEAKGIIVQFAYEKAWGFGFNDAGPALRYGALAKSNQRLTGP